MNKLFIWFTGWVSSDPNINFELILHQTVKKALTTWPLLKPKSIIIIFFVIAKNKSCQAIRDFFFIKKLPAHRERSQKLENFIWRK